MTNRQMVVFYPYPTPESQKSKWVSFCFLIAGILLYIGARIGRLEVREIGIFNANDAENL